MVSYLEINLPKGTHVFLRRTLTHNNDELIELMNGLNAFTIISKEG